MNLKEKARISIEKAKEIILSSIPNEEIVSVYIKGSYVQDELTPESDVDLVVILKTEKYLPIVYGLTRKLGGTFTPPFQAVAYTMNELQTGEMAINREGSITPVSSFVKHLDKLPLIYGKRPEGKLFTRTHAKDLSAHASAFRSTFLPEYQKGKFNFSHLVKQVFWLVEREQWVLGRNPEYSWSRLAELINEDDHIIHQALRLRRQSDVSEMEKKVFLQKLNSYLDSLNI